MMVASMRVCSTRVDAAVMYPMRPAMGSTTVCMSVDEDRSTQDAEKHAFWRALVAVMLTVVVAKRVSALTMHVSRSGGCRASGWSSLRPGERGLWIHARA